MRKLRKNNSLLMCLLIPLLLSMVIVQVGASDTVFSVNPRSYTARDKGDVFTIKVTVANVKNLAGFEYKLKWDPTLIKCTGYTKVDPVADLGWGKNFEAKDELIAGRHWYAVAAFADPSTTFFNGSVTLATYTFKVKGRGNCTLDLYDTKLGNFTAQYIPHETIDGKFETLAHPSASFPVVNIAIVIVIAIFFVVALYYVIRRRR